MSYDVNQVIIVGRLTQDPTVSQSSQGKVFCRLSIASNRGKEDVSFFNAVCFNKTAEFAGQYLKKGAQVVLSGRIKQDQWADKETGKNRSKIVIIVHDLQSVSSPPGQGNQEGGFYGQQAAPSTAPQANPYGDRYPPSSGFGNFDENQDLY